jgi:tetratricopeptide (TPR) repeat protein
VPSSIDPFSQQAKRIRQYLDNDALQIAEHAIVLALVQHPNSPSAWNLMGRLLAKTGQFQEASNWIKRYLEHSPNDSSTLVLFAQINEKLGSFQPAHALLVRAEQNANTFQQFLDISLEADRQGYAEIALRCVNLATAFPANIAATSQAHLQRARVLQTLGQSVEAAKIYRDLIRRSYLTARAWFALLDLKTERLTAREYCELIGASRNIVNTQDRTLIYFALGKAHEDASNFADAITAFREANAIAALNNPWNAGASTRHAQNILNAFADVKGLSLAPEYGAELIFLIGLPRSGTTLVEQVLSAHPDVCAPGELPYLPRIIQQESSRQSKPFPDWVKDMSKKDWQRLADEYLSLTARWRSTHPKSTDKLPENWLYVGVIAQMFPSCKIIDCTRDPVETVWSCYKQLFAPGAVNFSYRFEDLRAFWQSYRSAIEFWMPRIPRQLKEQNYERLVMDTEIQVRALLQFCNLEFSPSCLSPHLAQRTIRTPSAAQVREPMLAPSVKTRAYGSHLDSLRALFDQPC